MANVITICKLSDDHTVTVNHFCEPWENYLARQRGYIDEYVQMYRARISPIQGREYWRLSAFLAAGQVVNLTRLYDSVPKGERRSFPIIHPNAWHGLKRAEPLTPEMLGGWCSFHSSHFYSRVANLHFIRHFEVVFVEPDTGTFVKPTLRVSFNTRKPTDDFLSGYLFVHKEDDGTLDVTTPLHGCYYFTATKAIKAMLIQKLEPLLKTHWESFQTA